MKKAIIISVVLFAIPALGLATNEGNGNGNGGPEGNEGIIGPQGPTGPQGQPGPNGSNGANGVNGPIGVNGKDGKNGIDASTQFKGTDLALDAAVRIIDVKYLQVQAFDTYVFGSTPGSDVFGQGHNSTIGARIVIKLGKSYEERLLEKQALELKALEARLSLLGMK